MSQPILDSRPMQTSPRCSPRSGLLVAFLACFLVSPLSTFTPADEPVAKKEKPLPKAVQPEVQTAAWAQKWWMPRHEEKLAERKKMKRVDLVMIGDSITHGWEGAGKEIWQKYYADRHALNLGFSGDRTEQVLWRIDHGAIDDIQPRLAVVMIGTNNTGHRQDPAEETAAGIAAILERLEKKAPSAKVLLLAIFPRGETPNDKLRKLNDQINQRIAKLADNRRVYFLDINERFLDDNGVLPRSVMKDLLHPGAEGYQVWAEAMEPKIKQLLDEQAAQ